MANFEEQIKGHEKSEEYYLNSNYYKLCEYLRGIIEKEGKDKLVLDVGCNTGYETIRLLEFDVVIGIDIGERFIEKAREKGVFCRVCDIHNLDWVDKTFDIIYWNNGPEHSYDPLKAFQEIYRTLKKGGKFLGCLPAEFLVKDYKSSFGEEGDNWNPNLHLWRPNIYEIYDVLSKCGYKESIIYIIDANAMFGLENKASNNFYIIIEAIK